MSSRTPARAAALALLVLVAGACGPAGPPAATSPAPSAATPRPEFAWEKAALPLPAEVTEEAPGTSAGVPCSPCHAAEASLLHGVGPADGGLVAVGAQLPASRAIAYRSTDGRTWTDLEGFAPGEGESRATAVAAARATTVIVGMGADGGVAWTRTGTGAWRETRVAPDELVAVTATRDGFVAVSRAGSAVRSADGLAWSGERLPAAVDGVRPTGVAADGDRVVAVGEVAPGSDDDASSVARSTALAWVSTDGGRTWRAVPAQPALAAGPMLAVAPWQAGFVAVGRGTADDRALAWTSPDGERWTLAPEASSLANHGDPIRALAVTTGRDGLLAAGWVSDAGNGSGVLWTSPDGSAWTRLADQVSQSGASLAGAAFLDGRPIAVGTSGYPDNDQATAWFDATAAP